MHDGFDSTGQTPDPRIKERAVEVLQSAISHRQIKEQAQFRFLTLWQRDGTLCSLSKLDLLKLGYTAALFDRPFATLMIEGCLARS